jgi:hypothetical protein
MSQFEEDGAKLEDILQEERDRQVMEVEREISSQRKSGKNDTKRSSREAERRS